MTDPSLPTTPQGTAPTPPGPRWWRPGLQITGILLWGLGMLLGSQVANPHPTPHWDLTILRMLSHHRDHTLVWLGRMIEFWDGPRATPWLMLAALVLVFLRGHRLLAVLAVLMTAISWLPGHMAKSLFPRDRPPAWLEPVFHVTGANSFPSGHTGFITSTMIAGLFALGALRHERARRIWAWLCAPLVLLVAWSRMFIAVHYPTDVIGGALLAGGISLVLWPIWTGIFAVVGRRWPGWVR